jgi:hypothetical protein
LSPFGKDAPDSENNDIEIAAITSYLHEKIIPKFAKKWSKDIKQKKSIFEHNLTGLLHKKGIKMRHLGHIRYYAKNDTLKKILMNEMVARVIKIDIKIDMRDQMKKTGISSVEPYKDVVLKYFNMILCNDDDSSEYWNGINQKLKNKFITKCDVEYEIKKSNYKKIIKRIQRLIGVKLDCSKFKRVLHRNTR